MENQSLMSIYIYIYIIGYTHIHIYAYTYILIRVMSKYTYARIESACYVCIDIYATVSNDQKVVIGVSMVERRSRHQERIKER